ncbi:MAG: protein kinase [Chloroflexi bacterium]|nr:protein kinase [Chloroflexota bacterium]
MGESITIGGRYTVDNLEDDLIGEGGVGKVYLGKDNETNEQVAIKTLHSDKFTDKPEILERFQREGELLRQLNHPNIVKLLDSVEYDGIHYLVMEYVEGGDLCDFLSITDGFHVIHNPLKFGELNLS